MLLHLASALTIIFTVAKLIGVFSYSWLIVFLPIIITVGLPLAIFVGGAVLISMIAIIAAIFNE